MNTLQAQESASLLALLLPKLMFPVSRLGRKTGLAFCRHATIRCMGGTFLSILSHLGLRGQTICQSQPRVIQASTQSNG